jgi:hypothetical protein
MEMVNVTVTIPEYRVAEFYAMFASWLNGSSEASGGEPDVELLDWSPDDLEQAEHVWTYMSPPAKQLFVMLPQQPDEVSWEELGHALGTTDPFVVAGTLAWPARYAKQVGRVRPVKWGRASDGSGTYSLDPVVKALFEKVADGAA